MEKHWNALFEHYFENLICEERKSGFVRKHVLAKFVVKMVLSAVRSIMKPTKLDELHILPKDPLSAIVAMIMEGAVVKPRET